MTTALPYEIKKAPKTQVTRLVAPRIEFVTVCTPSGTDLAAQEGEYTDKQFYADLKKASKRLDAMAAKALKEDAQGKTKKFPA